MSQLGEIGLALGGPVVLSAVGVRTALDRRSAPPQWSALLPTIRQRGRPLFLAVLAGAVLWVPILSTELCVAIGTFHDTSWGGVVLAAPYYATEYADDPAVVRWLPICAATSALACLGPSVAVLITLLGGAQKAVRPSTTATHGTAQWMSLEERRARYVKAARPYGGIPIGEDYDVAATAPAMPFNSRDPKTWGNGGKPSMLVDPAVAGATHGFVIAASGGGKTASVTIPALYTWPGSTITFDPAGQAVSVTKQHRLALGHDVVEIFPSHLDEDGRVVQGRGYNALSWINVIDPQAEGHVETVLDWVGGNVNLKQRGDNGEFRVASRLMNIAILADMLWTKGLPPNLRNLSEFRRRVALPMDEMRGFLAQIATTSNSPVARDYARQTADLPEKTFGGVYFGATTETGWLSSAAIACMVCDDSFDPSGLARGDVDVFIRLGNDVLRKPGVSRAVMGGLLHAIYRAQGKVNGRILGLIDEARFLGRLDVLSDLRDDGRKYKFTMVTMWPDISKLKGVWGDEYLTFIAQSSWQSYAAINDLETAEHVSKACGEYGVVTHSDSTSRGLSGMSFAGRSSSKGTSASETKRRLITMDEVTRMRGDEAIIKPTGGDPFRCGRPFYFRRPEMMARMDTDKFERKPTTMAAE